MFFVVYDVLQASPHSCRIVSWWPVFQLCRVASFSHNSDLFCQVHGLLIQDSVPTSAGIILELVKLYLSGCEPWPLVICTESFSWHTHIFTKSKKSQCQLVHPDCEYKNSNWGSQSSLVVSCFTLLVYLFSVLTTGLADLSFCQ